MISFTERRGLLQKASVSTLDSEQELDLDLAINDSVIEPAEDLTPSDPPPGPIAKSGLVVLCTEIPSPRTLRDNGYVNVSSTQLPNRIISQSFHQECNTTTTATPPSTLDLSSGTLCHSGSKSPSDRLSSGDTRSKDSTGSVKSPHTSSITSQLSVMNSPVSSTRDVTLSTYNSLTRMSPLEPQPLTMQLDEVSLYIWQLWAPVSAVF